MSSTSPISDGGNVGSYTTSYYDNTSKFNPTTAVVIIVLIAGCFMLAFLSVLVRRCIRGNNRFPQSSVSPQSGNYNTKLTRGLDKADVDALPLVRSTDLGEKDDHECPVCLTEFEPEETLRLLPSCKHVFHQECIDAWFDSHSTCPLCRASLVGGDAGKNSTPAVEQVAPGVPVVRIYEASENEDSDVEVHGGVMHGGGIRREVPLEDYRTAVRVSQLSPMISREDEQSSARGTLFRNSESFKRAARGVEANESVAALDKDSSFRKPPLASASIRRSSSLSADLISLRNLLMGVDQNANGSSGSSRWFARAKSMESASRDRGVQNEYSREPSRDDWVTIDLETGKATSNAEPSTSNNDESLKGPAPERSWSDRFNLSSLKNLKGIAILSRSTSDVSSRHAPHLPM
ncbi:hypothetical protein KC19_8G020300 [Ceratodon purpureus]|uniref:RING-type E3 ubiquitin transferase n=1 Tax=Ceratodon purpureus TaxID=3225 RepID=A0A8T0GUE9_CERPU|nr:hypothetical protein KC19_8G020300 [Ceratodon purpureus]